MMCKIERFYCMLERSIDVFKTIWLVFLQKKNKKREKQKVCSLNVNNEMWE